MLVSEIFLQEVIMESKQYKFLAYPVNFTVFVVCLGIYLAALVYFIVYSIVAYDPENIGWIIGIAVIMAFGAACFFLIGHYSLTFHVVVIDDKKISVRSIFGEVYNCNIEDIESISVKHGRKGAAYIQIEDSEDRHQPQLLYKKGAHIRFRYTKGRVALLNEIWHGDVNTVPTRVNAQTDR